MTPPTDRTEELSPERVAALVWELRDATACKDLLDSLGTLIPAAADALEALSADLKASRAEVEGLSKTVEATKAAMEMPGVNAMTRNRMVRRVLGITASRLQPTDAQGGV